VPHGALSCKQASVLACAGGWPTPGITNTVNYTYNPDGSMASLTYPSGRVVTYAPSAAGRTLSAVESAHSLNYVTGATYALHGALSGLQNGASVSARWTYNSRLQGLAHLWP
jgi:hypothetical protein